MSDVDHDDEPFPEVREQLRGLPRLAAPPSLLAGVLGRLDEAPRAEPEAVAVAAAPVALTPMAASEAGLSEADGEALSAYIDGALAPSEQAALRARLATDTTLRAEHAALVRVRALLQALPRLQAPPPFLSRVLAAADEDDRSRAARELDARRARLQWWGRVARLAQAACFLAIAAGGVALSTPETRNQTWIDPAERRVGALQERGAVGAPRVANEDDGGSLSQVAPGPYDATWELTAPGDFALAVSRTEAFANAYTRCGEVRGEHELGLVLEVPANAIDDLHLQLDQDPAVESSQANWRAMEAAHAEQDRVVLKNGFVLVGRILRENGREVLLRAGDVNQTIARDAVERTERATALRKVRIVLR